MKKKNSAENSLGLKDYSHLPKAKDFSLSEKPSAKTEAFIKAAREALEALRRKEQKNGQKDTSVI